MMGPRVRSCNVYGHLETLQTHFQALDLFTSKLENVSHCFLFMMDIIELDRIISLLNDDNFQAELQTFRRSYQRLKIRLRNNQLNAQLKHLRALINRLEIGFPAKLFESKKRTQSNPKSTLALLSYLSEYITNLNTILTKAIAVYGFSQPYFRVGHLVQHYLVIRASLARLIFCYKALLVYSADLYHELFKVDKIEELKKKQKRGKKLLAYDTVKGILVQHNCKPKQESAITESPDVICISPEDKEVIKEEEVVVGQLIDRKTLRPMRACKRK